MKKWISSLLVLVLCIGFLPCTCVGSGVSAETKTESTTNYMTGKAFVKYLVKKLKLEVKKEKTPYLNAAYRAGIYEPSDIASLDSPITREEMAVLLNRADEYLHGDTLDASYINTILDKRISDISSIDKEKREAVAKVYGRGIIVGYTNGEYSQDREFRGKAYVPVSKAKTYVKATINPDKRLVMSRDGQLTRSTNLPKNADKFEYILASFPNEYYDQIFFFERYDQWDEKTQTLENWIMNEEYCYPYYTKNMTYKTFFWEGLLSEQMDLYMDQWQEDLTSYITNIFNVDYRTVDQTWINKFKECCAPFNGSTFESSLEPYFTTMKQYKTIIQTSKVVIDPSSFYQSTDGYYMRAYVKYKVSATKIPGELKDIIYSRGTYLKNFKLDAWNEAIIDLRLASSNGFDGDGSYIKAEFACFLFY